MTYKEAQNIEIGSLIKLHPSLAGQRKHLQNRIGIILYKYDKTFDRAPHKHIFFDVYYLDNKKMVKWVSYTNIIYYC